MKLPRALALSNLGNKCFECRDHLHGSASVCFRILPLGVHCSCMLITSLLPETKSLSIITSNTCRRILLSVFLFDRGGHEIRLSQRRAFTLPSLNSFFSEIETQMSHRRNCKLKVYCDSNWVKRLLGSQKGDRGPALSRPAEKDGKPCLLAGE